MIRNLSIIAAAVIVVALPFALRQPDEATGWQPGDPMLVIVTPHSEAIRYEFGHAFSDWYREQYGKPVKIEWLNVGGTTEISRYLTSEFAASARATGNPETASARIDLFFGGGEYDHSRLAKQGFSVPPWPAGQEARQILQEIPERIGGETWRTPLFIGTAVSTFGICYNVDRLRELNLPAPRRWADLAQPELRRQVALADPTKSGSVAKAFEMIIHQQMYEAVRAAGQSDEQIEAWESGRETAPPEYDATLGLGWENGVRLVQLIGANARYFTDSASKVVTDVAMGDAAAGLAIDFYARYEAQVTSDERMKFVTPSGGSSVSADPISLLRGAPNREVAVRFIDFVLSEAGQRLWTYRAGTPGGPKKYTLRRLPIRRDFYADATHQKFSADDLADPTVNPYELVRNFTYRSRWTAGHFNVHRDLIRAMCMDSGQELRTAWEVINAHGGPASQPAAMALLQKLPDQPEPLTWKSARTITTRYDRMELLRMWTECCRENYRQALKAVVTR